MVTITLQTLHKDLANIKGEITFIKHIMEEEYELSEWANKELEEARNTSEEEYISQEEIEKEFLP